LVSVSFLIALFLLAHFERSTGKRLSVPLTAGSLLAVSGLVVLANLIRIVLLVLFKILPAHPMHDLIGLLCLVFYVILPSILLVQWLYRVNGQWLPLLPSTADQTPRYGVAGPAALLAVLVLLPLLKPAQPARQSDPPFNSLPGYRATALPDGITKLEREESLVYVKPVAAFYSTEHSPLICWRGSGYSFGRISRQQAQGQALYTGMLQKGADMLYTAWWFDNGQHRTISQWEWRWNMLLGAPPYSLVNVSAATPAELQKALAIALRRD
jgi:exosortase N